MGKLKRLLATIGRCTLILLPGNYLRGAQILDDLRFVNAEETIGKTLEEVRKEIGEPNDKGACNMITPIEGKTVTLAGEGWAYRRIYSNESSFLSICFIQELSVAELRTDTQLGEEGQQRVITREILDHRLMRNIIDGQLDRPRWVDPDGDKI